MKNMRLLIDTNILIDVLDQREPFFPDSLTIWRYCESKDGEGVISAVSVTNLVYIMRKYMTPEAAERVVALMAGIFTIESVDASCLTEAASLKWKDFEGALQFISARKAHADAIVTRNPRDFSGCGIPVLTPRQLILRLTESPDSPAGAETSARSEGADAALLRGENSQ